MKNLDQHNDNLLNAHMVDFDAEGNWLNEITNEVYLMLTKIEITRIFDTAIESMGDEEPITVSQRITKETLQFRAWHKSLQAKRPETTEEEAMGRFGYLNEDEFSKSQLEEMIQEAVEELTA